MLYIYRGPQYESGALKATANQLTQLRDIGYVLDD